MKWALLGGIGFIVLCVLLGIAFGGDPSNAVALDRLQAEANRQADFPAQTPQMARRHAQTLLDLRGLSVSALAYDSPSLALLIEEKRPIWKRFYGGRTYRVINFLDRSASFANRWESGLSKQFETKTSARAATTPRLGRVEILPRSAEKGSTNPLDYLDFKFVP